MFHLQRLILTSLSIFMIVALTACGIGQAVEPTATAVDVNAINTAAVATVQAQMTLNAALTPVATATLPPSETPTEAAATSTLDSGVSVETPAVTFTPTVQVETPGGAGATTPTMTAIASFTPISGSSGGGVTGPVCKNMGFMGDVTIPDGTIMKPWEKFTKIWSIKNTGTCTWDEGFYFAAWPDSPPSMGANQGTYKIKLEKDFVVPDQVINMGIEMYAPGDPGEYIAHWQMYDDLGQPFGYDITVVIKVVK